MIHIIHSSARAGGIKTVSESLSKGLVKKGYDCSLFNMHEQGSSLLSSLKKTLSYFNKKSSQDIFILQHIEPLILGLFLRFKKYKRIINVIHIDLLTYYKSSSFFKKIIIKYIFFLLKHKAIIFVSKEAELKAKRFFKLKNTFTIYNIMVFNYDPITKIKNNCFTLGSVARLHEVKNIDLLIRIINELHKNIPVKLLIFGSGNEEVKLKDYVNKKNASSFVFFMGEFSDITKLYASFDALISFSSIEGLPTVILESIQNKKPVFYTDCTSGPRELMAPHSNPLIKTNSYEKTNCGYLVKPVFETATYSNNVTEYEKEYVQILESFIEDVQSKKFSMQFDTKPFSEEAIIEQWLKVIKEIQ